MPCNLFIHNLKISVTVNTFRGVPLSVDGSAHCRRALIQKLDMHRVAQTNNMKHVTQIKQQNKQKKMKKKYKIKMREKYFVG